MRRISDTGTTPTYPLWVLLWLLKNSSDHGEKVWFPFQIVTHRGQRSGENMSDHSLCWGQFQLHLHFNHRYVFTVYSLPYNLYVTFLHQLMVGRFEEDECLLNAGIMILLLLDARHCLHKLVSQAVFLSQLVYALSFVFSFSLSSFSLYFFSLLDVCGVSSLTPLPDLSLRSHSSHLALRGSAHPHSYLFLPSLRSQKNGWLSGMHSLPPLLCPCLPVWPSACPSSRKHSQCVPQACWRHLSFMPVRGRECTEVVKINRESVPTQRGWPIYSVCVCAWVGGCVCVCLGGCVFS